MAAGTILANGVRLSYETWGEGAPLYCLHGGMGVDSAYLKVPAITGLGSKSRRVVIHDQRGHGKSARSGMLTYTHATWVEDVRQLARLREEKRLALLGHSYGGFLALEFALKHPAMLTHLILVASSAGPVPLEPPPLVGNDGELRAYLKEQWPGHFAGPAKFWDVFETIGFSAAPFLAAFRRELPLYNVRDRAASIRTPALLLVGDRDPYLPDMEWLAKTMPRAELEVFRSTGHFPFLEAPGRFKARVAGFLGTGAA